MVCTWVLIVCWVDSPILKEEFSGGGMDSSFEEGNSSESLMVGKFKLDWLGVSGCWTC